MEGLQSFEQRSSEIVVARGNRVIIVNRREPNLNWQTPSNNQTFNGALSGSFWCSYCRASRFGFFKSCLGCECNRDRPEKSASRGRLGGRLSNVSFASSGSASESVKMNNPGLISNSFDFGPFPSNQWRTSKYTPLNFLPKNLFEQFKRLANFYFLIGAIIQVFIPSSPVGSATSLIPLVFVVSTTAIKQAYEDYLRHKLDNEVNNRACHLLKENNNLVKARSMSIRVGDIVHVKNNEEIPCDMILLAASGTGDRCYITTANLDGETSLKSRSCFQVRQQVGGIETINRALLLVECEKPNATLYEFNGFLRAPKDSAAYERLMKEFRDAQPSPSSSNGQTGSLGGVPVSQSQAQARRVSMMRTILSRVRRTKCAPKVVNELGKQQQQQQQQLKSGRERLVEISGEHIEIPLDMSNLLLRASRLRNTNFIYGLAIYTGEDTRLAHNSQVKPNKVSSLEGRVNVFLGIAFIALIMMTLINVGKHYLSPSGPADESSFLRVFISHFVLYNYLVPISLYVTLEFVKFLGTIYVLEDPKLQAIVRSSQTVAQEGEEGEEGEGVEGAGVNADADADADVMDVVDVKMKEAARGPVRARKEPGPTRTQIGPQCNSSDLNEDLGQVEVLFSDKTGTLTENKMHFMAGSIGGRLYRSIGGRLYEQPEGLCHMPALEVTSKLASASVNRYAVIGPELARSQAGPRSRSRSVSRSPRAANCSRSSKSSLERESRLPPSQRPFDHRWVPPLSELKLVSECEQNQSVTDFFICLCLCSTLSLNEQVPLEECLKASSMGRLCYESASPDEASLIAAAACFGIVICKSSERECFIAIRRGSATEGRQETGPDGRPKPGAADARATQQRALGRHSETRLSTRQYIVLKFERLLTFEFNSTRKRMSVLCRDCESGRNILITKGSESVLDCIGLDGPLGADGKRAINTILAHFEAFSKSGLRTMLVARRWVGNDEYERMAAELRDARLLSSQTGRVARMCALYRQVESQMSLVGSSAVEDSLQEGVPETIADLKAAGIKVWLLTGDKLETAISVAYLCRLLDRNMNLLQLARQRNSGDCKRLLEAFAARIGAAQTFGDDDDDDDDDDVEKDNDKLEPELATSLAQRRGPASKRASKAPGARQPRPLVPVQAQSQAGRLGQKAGQTAERAGVARSRARISPYRSASLPAKRAHDDNDDDDDERAARFALVADGRSLHYAMKYAKRELEYVCSNCVCVLGCRLSPIQKAEIVEMIKRGESSPITAAIGDGANDVSMIQEAHVGIGIRGKEGRQAVNSSDFAISRFHMLNRLLLVHGHLFYHRTANMINYFFYKNVLFTVPQFVYSLHCGANAALSLYHPVMLISYNMLFTSVPILLYGLSEVHLDERLLESRPRLYRLNARNVKLNFAAFFRWLLMGALQATIAFYVIYFVWANEQPFEAPTQRVRLIGFALVLFNALVLITTFKLCLISKRRSLKLRAASWLSCLALPPTFYLMSLLDLSHLFYDNSLEGQFRPLLESPVYWLTIGASTIAALIPDVLVRLRQIVGRAPEAAILDTRPPAIPIQ